MGKHHYKLSYFDERIIKIRWDMLAESQRKMYKGYEDYKEKQRMVYAQLYSYQNPPGYY